MVPENEYHPYYKPYIAELADSKLSIVDCLKQTGKELNLVLNKLPKEKQMYRYVFNIS